jgi:putative aldouronate transport system permease protein
MKIPGRTAKPQSLRRENPFIHEMRKNWVLTLMILPSMIYVFIFSYLPLPGIIIAFKNYNYRKGILGSSWCGFQNFEFLFSTGVIARVTFNTVFYNIAFMIVDITLELTVAVILSEIAGKLYKKISQTLLLMPFFVSWVVAGAIAFNLLSNDYGLVNGVLVSLGKEKVDFLNNQAIWPFLFVAFHAWKSIGYGSVVYLAAVTGFDQEIYEAAAIDGAGIFKRVFKITLPLLKPTVIVLILLGLGNIIKGDFAMFYNLTGDNPLLYNVSDIIETYVYRSLAQLQNFSMSTAAGFYQSVLGFLIIMTVNTVIKKMQPDYALF